MKNCVKMQLVCCELSVVSCKRRLTTLTEYWSDLIRDFGLRIVELVCT